MVGTVNVVAELTYADALTESVPNTPTPRPTPSPSASPAVAQPHLRRHSCLSSYGAGPVELEQIASGLTAPNDLSVGGRWAALSSTNRTGKSRIVKDQRAARHALPRSLLSASGSTGERGLLGLAFHPGYNDPSSPGFRKFYTYSSEPVTGAADFTVPKTSGFDHESVVAEWQVSAGNPDVADPGSRREVLRVDEPQSNHNGGKLAFRPGEPYLYISLGDGGAGNDVGDGHNPAIGNGQDLTTVLGKILRIDPIAPKAVVRTTPDGRAQPGLSGTTLRNE